MTDGQLGWSREKRRLPADLVAAAAANPGGSVAEIDGSVAEIDGSVVSDPNGYVPPEAIIGPELGHLL